MVKFTKQHSVNFESNMRHLIENENGVRVRQGAIGYDPVQIYQYLSHRYITYHAPFTRIMFMYIYDGSYMSKPNISHVYL